MTKPPGCADEYAGKPGCLQEKRILAYLRQGNRDAVAQIVLSPGYRDAWVETFDEDFESAWASVQASWSQACFTAAQEGLSETEITRICVQYQQQMRSADAVRRILDLSAAFRLDLADRVAAHKLEGQYSPIVQRCRAYIRGHIGEPMTVTAVASAIGYSRSHLSRIFREETGETMYAFIQRQKLELAKRYLLSFSHPVSEIWRELEFCSQSHFSTFIKRMTGQTPSEFRQSLQTAKTVDAAEMGTAETMTSFMQIGAEEDASDDYQDTLEGLHDYAEEVGYTQELHLLYCVRKGRVHELESELGDPEYNEAMNTLFRNNRRLAYETFLFLLPQVHAAAVISGISMKSARQLYMDFSQRARGADVQELLSLIKEAYVEFATRVNATQLQ